MTNVSNYFILSNFRSKLQNIDKESSTFCHNCHWNWTRESTFLKIELECELRMLSFFNPSLSSLGR
jgi:hypothetical protein